MESNRPTTLDTRDSASRFAAQLTPIGRSAVAVIAVCVDSSSDFESELDQLFQPIGTRSFSRMPNRSIVYGTWRSSGEDLIVVRGFHASPAPFQGRLLEDHARSFFEIHCHGGPMAAKSVLNALEQTGIQAISQKEFAVQIAGRWQAESLQALTQSETRKAAGWLMHVHTLQTDFLKHLRHEAAMTGQLPDDSQEQDEKLHSLKTTIQSALDCAEFGKHLTEPRRIVLWGRPNTGKSSLVNRLVGFQRAIVNPVAGTTRDVVGQRTAIDGWCVEIKDTAGIREATNEIEAVGIQKAHQEIRNANLSVAVLDASLPWTEAEQEWIARLQPDFIVANKSDLGCDAQTIAQAEVIVSALNGDNIDQLIQILGQRLVTTTPPQSQWFPISDWQETTLKMFAERIERKDFVGSIQLLSE